MFSSSSFFIDDLTETIYDVKWKKGRINPFYQYKIEETKENTFYKKRKHINYQKAI